MTSNDKNALSTTCNSEELLKHNRQTPRLKAHPKHLRGNVPAHSRCSPLHYLRGPDRFPDTKPGGGDRYSQSLQPEISSPTVTVKILVSSLGQLPWLLKLLLTLSLILWLSILWVTTPLANLFLQKHLHYNS